MDAETFLDDDDREAIIDAIERAETRTAAEIVCAVSTESDRYDRAESVAGLGCGLVFLGLLHALTAQMQATEGSWDTVPGPSFGWESAAVVVGFVIGSVVASYWHDLRRLLVRPAHLDGAVERTAWRVFGMQGVRDTSRESGVLIYVSLFERRVSVLADDRAREILGDEGVEELKDLAADHLEEGGGRETFVRIIERAADLLAPELPAGDQDPDELDNKMLVFHPRPQ
jgi:putative membrane protein